MKKIRIYFPLIILGLLLVNPLFAGNEERDVPSFSEIALRIPGKLYVKQGNTQSVKIEAKSSTLEDIITEVKDRKLTIRFKSKNYFFQSFNPGKIEILITVPEIDGLSVSGSGDIIAEGEINTRILDLAVSGSGDIVLDDLKADRVKSAISGSGDIIIKDGGEATDLSVAISGSGDVKAGGFEAKDVAVRIAGSGNCTVTANRSLKARVAGSGNVYYKGNPNIDSSVAGSGRVKKM
ncbi:MAG TPA: head GIN domain-containing protein [Draconibacterium sp.]|nr:head GIN domain-containing protein [Draconibacterium sp.]